MVDKLLPSKSDIYNGLSIDPSGISDDPEDFYTKLAHSIAVWKLEGKKVVWLTLQIDQSKLIEPARRCGLILHHAQSDKIVMYRWLLESVSKVPAFGGFSVGVGGFVYKPESEEVLMVVERFTIRKTWKIPGGTVEVNENLQDAVIREIKEETNIDTQIISLLGFVHVSPVQFGNANLFLVFLLKPTSDHIIKEEAEILDCKWMKVQEVIADPKISLWSKVLTQSGFQMFTGKSLPPIRSPRSNQEIRLSISPTTVEYSLSAKASSLLIPYQIPPLPYFKLAVCDLYSPRL